MNDYLKLLLKLPSESLCDRFNINETISDDDISIEEIINILKYRFNIDFEEDIEYIIHGINYQNSEAGIFYKLFENIITLLNDKISFKKVYSREIRVNILHNNYKEKDNIHIRLNEKNADKSYNFIIDHLEKYDDSKSKMQYIITNLYLIMLLLNDSSYYNYSEFERIYNYEATSDIDTNDNASSTDKPGKNFKIDAKILNNHNDYKESFIYNLVAEESIFHPSDKYFTQACDDLHTKYFDAFKYDDEDDDSFLCIEELENLFTEDENHDDQDPITLYNDTESKADVSDETNIESKSKSKSMICEAIDNFIISSINSFANSPYRILNINKKYTSKNYKLFVKKYFETFNEITKYNNNRDKYELEDENTNSNDNKKERDYKKYLEYYTSERELVTESERMFTELIYGFSIIKGTDEVISHAFKKNVELENSDIDINKIYEINSNFIIIPNVYLRRKYCHIVTKITLNCMNRKDYSIREEFFKNYNSQVLDFCIYEAFIYYPILMSYVLLTLKYIFSDKHKNRLLSKFQNANTSPKEMEENLRTVLDEICKNNKNMKKDEQFEWLSSESDVTFNSLPKDMSCFYKHLNIMFDKKDFPSYFASIIYNPRVNETAGLVNSYMKTFYDFWGKLQ